MKTAILVTGANRGLGLHLCSEAFKHGYQIYATGRNELETRKALEGAGVKVQRVFEMNFSAPLSTHCADSLQGSVSAIPNLRYVIHVASPFTTMSLLDTSEETCAMYGNFIAQSMFLTKAVSARFATNPTSDKQKMVFIGAIPGSPGMLKLGPFSVFKRTMQTVAETMCVEGKERGYSSMYLNLGTVRDKGHSAALEVGQVAKTVFELMCSPAIVPYMDLFASRDLSRMSKL